MTPQTDGSGDAAATGAPPPVTADDPQPPPGIPTRPPQRPSRSRRSLVTATIVVATIITILGMFALWADRLILNPERWSETSTQLLADPNVRNATSVYLVDQLYARVDVRGVVRSSLPKQFAALAGPVSGALQNAAVGVVSSALEHPVVQRLWRTANRNADEALVSVITGNRGPIAVSNGAVKLDLAAVLRNVAADLGVPQSAINKLPPSIGDVTVVKSSELDVVQTGGRALHGLALLFAILAPVLYALAVILARGFRRRVLMRVGGSILFAGVIVFLGRTLLVNHLANAVVQDPSLRPAASSILKIATGPLSEIAGACVLVGGVLWLGGWVAGPAREAVAVRRFVAPALSEHPAMSFAVVLLLLGLIFIWQPIPATGNWWGILIFTVLALLGTEILRRQTATEFPLATTAGVSLGAGRAFQSVRQRVHAAPAAGRATDPPQAQGEASVTEQLERLAALRDDGAVSEEEYSAAKAVLLGRSAQEPASTAAGPAEAAPAEPPAPASASE
ncbi:MAG TPA: SHOCT domain-containing protein [Solirubrobacteraceae bacterium]